MATQPGTVLAVFNQQGQLPDYMKQFVDDAGTNITPRTTVPSLSPEGKNWTIAIDGQKTPLQRRNTDGDLEPLPIMKVVVLDFAKQRGRAFYEGNYDPKNVSAPICWSDDGVTPDASLPGPFGPGTEFKPGTSRKISPVCASCPNAIKGSKVIEGTNKATTACAQHLMVAILPDPALQLPAVLQKPLRLKLAITSVWDATSPDQEQEGWLSFDRYVQWLNARGCKHTALVVTKMKFDPAAAFPKIFFSAERPLEPHELAIVGPLSQHEDVKKLLGGTWTPAGVDGVPRDQQDVAQPTASDEPQAGAPAGAPPPAAAATPAGYEMAPAEQHTYAQYREGGWTDQQLITNGKLIAQKPEAPPPAEVIPAAPPVAAAPVAEAVIVGEPAATAAPPTVTAAEASPPATAAEAEAVVVTEVAQPTAVPSPGIAAPAAVVVQEPAQATAPPPLAAQAPEPPAAAAAAAAVTSEVSTDVPQDVSDLLAEWGDASPPAQ